MPNRLIREKSPYLLQHAHNPVDWYPWGEEAFALARAEQKPIFLSVGYSTCHWCHVMEAESFESPAIASLMNRDFVNIKVDREERPDVDRVYMSALHAMGENGGWPMSMFLTPDLRPFYGGTYFPPATRYGRIGFPDLLQRIRTIWATERGKVLESASGLTEHLRASVTAVRSERVPGAGVLDLAFSQFARTYDTHAGGFGGAPKFPRPAVFRFLLGYAARTGNADALAMTTTSLHRMALGGVYDHLGGGFHRYAVDAEWRVPHFEKMLYDQAQLVQVYLDAYLVTKERFFAEVAEDVVRYVLRDLALPEGGFCSAEDADSPKPDSPGETGEGAFYLWTRDELDRVLDKPTANAFALAFGVESGGNAAVDPHSEFGGKNILFRARTDEQVASLAGLPVESVAALLYSARTLLANVRATRPRPGRDDKVLASWNGLMIGACARAGALLSAPRFVDAAVRAADFVMHRLYDGTRERLIRRYRDGEAKHDAHLEDYAFTASGLLDLYEATFDARWLRHALHLTKVQMSLFRDEQSGGFLDTSGEDPSILVRTREQYDGAEPSGNSVAALTLLRLAHLTGDRSFQDAGEDVLRTFAPVLQEHPHAVPFMATALAFHHGSGREIVIAGRRGEPRTEALVTEVRKRYLPESVIVYVQAGEKGIAAISPFAASLARQNDEASAYVCERQTCRLPTADPAELGRILDGQPPGTDLR